MQGQHSSYITQQEYLELERQAETKSEYWNGEIHPMGRVNVQHSLITTNAIANLGLQLRKNPCTVYTGNLRLKVSSTGLYTYADVIVVCGQARIENEDNLLNPTVIVEVFSKSTESYDRGTKFVHYRTIESLIDYLLISQDTACIEHRSRDHDDKWLLSIYQGLDSVAPIPSIGCELPLADVYDRVEWSSEDAARGWLRFVKEPSEAYLT